MSLSAMNWKRGLLRLWAVAAVFSSLSTISVVAASESFQTFVPKPDLNDCELMKAFHLELPWFCKRDAPPYTVSASSVTIKIVSRQNNLIVEKISANRGNCQVAGAFTLDGQRQFPFTLRFGNTLEIETACVDSIIEVTVDGPSLGVGGENWVPNN